jgi:hypothetical protein
MSAERFSGAVGISRMTVRHGDTAIALGSGDVPVLGTPQVIALAENATITALAEHLDQSETTVGVHVEHKKDNFFCGMPQRQPIDCEGIDYASLG